MLTMRVTPPRPRTHSRVPRAHTLLPTCETTWPQPPPVIATISPVNLSKSCFFSKPPLFSSKPGTITAAWPTPEGYPGIKRSTRRTGPCTGKACPTHKRLLPQIRLSEQNSERPRSTVSFGARLRPAQKELVKDKSVCPFPPSNGDDNNTAATQLTFSLQ